jgi:hypothetical protein
MILDRHHGLLNGAKEHIEGYPPLINMWCSHHFAAKIWKKQQSYCQFEGVVQGYGGEEI